MNKVFERILSFGLVSMMVAGACSTAIATDDREIGIINPVKDSQILQYENMSIEEKEKFIHSDEYTTTYELVEIVEKQKLSTEELERTGMSVDDIAELRSINIADEIEERQAMSHDELRELGMQEEQIVALKNYDGSEEALRSISASLSGRASIAGPTYQSSQRKTIASLMYFWQWSGTPWFSHTDLVAVGNSENFYFDSSSYAGVQYIYNGPHGPYRSFWSSPSVNHGDSGIGGKASHAVIGRVDYDRMGNPMPYYANNGYLTLKVYRYGNERNLGMLGKYGHYQLGVTPNVTISASGANISVKFSGGLYDLGAASAWN